ncbi:hypothetical protein AB0H28_29125, partial [Micromonospora sp. NPDC050980]|uniref:hypothetical protein n=1 Tax=Micromonospora sp. NPDC050980 TaxID=3155161 RepID=UPI0033D5DCAF
HAHAARRGTSSVRASLVFLQVSMSPSNPGRNIASAPATAMRRAWLSPPFTPRKPLSMVDQWRYVVINLRGLFAQLGAKY